MSIREAVSSAADNHTDYKSIPPTIPQSMPPVEDPLPLSLPQTEEAAVYASTLDARVGKERKLDGRGRVRFNKKKREPYSNYIQQTPSHKTFEYAAKSPFFRKLFLDSLEVGIDQDTERSIWERTEEKTLLHKTLTEDAEELTERQKQARIQAKARQGAIRILESYEGPLDRLRFLPRANELQDAVSRYAHIAASVAFLPQTVIDALFLRDGKQPNTQSRHSHQAKARVVSHSQIVRAGGIPQVIYEPEKMHGPQQNAVAQEATTAQVLGNQDTVDIPAVEVVVQQPISNDHPDRPDSASMMTFEQVAKKWDLSARGFINWLGAGGTFEIFDKEDGQPLEVWDEHRETTSGTGRSIRTISVRDSRGNIFELGANLEDLSKILIAPARKSRYIGPLSKKGQPSAVAAGQSATVRDPETGRLMRVVYRNVMGQGLVPTVTGFVDEVPTYSQASLPLVSSNGHLPLSGEVPVVQAGASRRIVNAIVSRAANSVSVSGTKGPRRMGRQQR